ncbi:MAG TPA: PolC-type DNA polymerase III [bacterium]|nr:PolC-type DNA polymerase III [bacterium]
MTPTAQTEAAASPFFELLQQIPLQCHEQERLLQSEILSVQIDPQRQMIWMKLQMPGPVTAECYDSLANGLKATLPDVSKVILDVHYADKAPSPAEYLALHGQSLVSALIEEADIAEGWFAHCRLALEGETLVLQVPHELALQQMERKQAPQFLSDMMKARCGAALPAKARMVEALRPEITPEMLAAAAPEKPKESAKLTEPVSILGRPIAAEPQSMNVTDEQNNFVCEGEIVLYETITTRAGRHLVKMTVTDYVDSMEVSFFHENDGKYKGGLKERDWVRVRGDLRFNKYAGDDLTVTARDIMKVPPPESRMDRAAEKRVELHCHTQMSRMDGLSKIDRLIERAAKWGHKAIAITDHGVVQAYPEARAAAKKHGIKLILGIEGYLVDEFKKEKGLPIYHIILLVKNKTGLKNLYRLVSESHLHYFYKRPLIPKELLQKHREGLIVGSACEQGEIWQHLLKKDKPMDEVVDFYDYVEIQPCANNEFMIADGAVKDLDQLQALTREIYELGKKRGKMVLATGDSHFLEPQDEVYRKIIHAGMGYGVERQAPLYFKTTDELKRDFEYFAPEIAHELVVVNPQKIADMVEDVEPLPTETLSPHWEGADELLRQTATDQAKALYGDPLPDFIEKRLKKELDAIINNKFSTLYVIAMKLVKKSMADGYLVGSRGSVGSSFVAYLCGITEVNPLAPHWRCPEGHYHEFPENPGSSAGVDMPEKKCPKCGSPTIRDGFSIAFEVFMGFKGDKMPDIDLNFSGEYQHVAHKYVEELFGKDHCFRAGTISAVKDKIAFGFVKKFVEEVGRKARNAELNRLVKGCSGVSKTTGQHPGGIVILPKHMEITDVCPVQYPADNKDGDVITTHFDYDSMHDCLVKLDILGHDNPTSLKRLETMTGVSAVHIPLNDPDTMSLFSGTQALKFKEKIDLELGSLGIPEFGTTFAMDMLKDTRPTKFEHLARLSGLAHGTDVWLGNAQELIKKGTATLSTVISTRDDMLNDLVAQKMDEALAFKIMESVRKGKGLTPEFEKALAEAKIPSWYVESCRKIKYIFPKAHAVAYCIMSFRIAYFKVHYPLAFYADYFTNKSAGFDATMACGGLGKVKEHIKNIKAMEKPTNKELDEAAVLEVAAEMYARGFKFLNVDIYKSASRQFKIEKDGNGVECLRPPLIGLPGLGETAAESIVEERAKGEFVTVEDLVERCGVNKNVVEILKSHGCLGAMPDSNQASLF